MTVYSINRVFMARNEKLNLMMKEESREKILEAALGLFAKNGKAATRIGDIASKAGISHGLLYHYYQSKDEIFTELIRGAFEKLIAAAENLKAMPVSGAEKIELAMRTLIRSIRDDTVSADYHLLIAKASESNDTPEQARLILEEKSRIPYELMEDIFVQGQKEGSIRENPASELSLLFWTIIKGLAMQKAFAGDRYKSPDPDLILRMFIK